MTEPNKKPAPVSIEQSTIYTRAMFRLAHLSDIHLGPLPDVTYRDLASKRVTGYINWQRNRRKKLDDTILNSLVQHLKGQEPDHIALTGDLVNLALDGEIEMARRWLEQTGSPEALSVVPGNHDAYVPGALDRACRAWGPWMRGDTEHDPVDSRGFPYCRKRGQVALIGVSSARATAPFMANGFFRRKQAEQLEQMLAETGAEGLFRVILIHHPPVRLAAVPLHRLQGISLFQKTVRKCGVEMVLHGHTHLPTINWIKQPSAVPAPVVGVAAAGQEPGGRRPPARYNLFEIGGTPGDWQVSMTEYGISGHASGVHKLAEHRLYGIETADRAVG